MTAPPMHRANPTNRVPHPSRPSRRVGYRAKLDRRSPPHLKIVILSAGARRQVERPGAALAPVVAFADAFALALASEIGPGFIPDIHRTPKNRGFSPWGMLSSPEASV